MEMPQYDGVLERWKVDLIIHRAKLNGFKPHEIPDALQQAALVVMDFSYDPDHAKGARERTVLTVVVDRCLRKMKRSELRYQAYLEDLYEDATEATANDDHVLAAQFVDAIAKLTADEQIVFYGLLAELPTCQIARQLGCGWHTVKNMISNLRSKLADMGLREGGK